MAPVAGEQRAISAEQIQSLIERAATATSKESAREALDEAVRLAIQGNFRRLESAASCELGRVLRRMGVAHDVEALACLHRAHEISVELADVQGQVAALSELGLHSFQCSDLANALPFLNEAEQLCKLNGMLPELADVYETLGAVYHTMGQLQTALEYDRHELDIAVRLHDPRLTVQALDALACTESALGQHDAAMAHFEQCAAAIAQMPSGKQRSLYEAIVHCDWAEALCAAGRWDEARAQAEKAVAMTQSIGSPGAEGQARYALARILLGLGMEQAAEQILLRAHALYATQRNKNYRGKIERELSGVFRRRGDYRQALEYLDLAIATEASMQREAAMHLGAQQRAREKMEGLKREKNATERVLFNVLPDTIARRILAGAPRIAEERQDVSILFADLVGFTELASRVAATDLLEMLDRIFSHFDRLAREHGLAKIKTIGDSYMAAGGVPDAQADHLERIARLALAMRDTLGELNRSQGSPLALRIGVHAGPVVAGVIGSSRLSYDLWGETVNVASRLESSGIPGRIHVSAVVKERLRPQFIFRPRGRVMLKGVGEVETYFLDGTLA